MGGKKSLRGGLALVVAALVAVAGWWLQQGEVDGPPRAADPAACVAPAGVETPGIDHRGARRIVTGAEGEYYWTTDHYESFEVIVR